MNDLTEIDLKGTGKVYSLFPDKDVFDKIVRLSRDANEGYMLKEFIRTKIEDFGFAISYHFGLYASYVDIYELEETEKGVIGRGAIVFNGPPMVALDWVFNRILEQTAQAGKKEFFEQE